MEIVTVDKDNIMSEHICCAISNNEDCQVLSKKAWLKARMDDGLVFKKGNVRGKCFIEYIPAEKAWAPIDAYGYTYIDCLWVAGQYKGQGNANLLLDECIKDSKAKGKKGLVILTSNKKRPFLADPKFLKHKGFIIADKCEPFFELAYLPFDNAAAPRFKACVKGEAKVDDSGFRLYYADQCPYTAKYVPIICDMAKDMGVRFEAVHILSAEDAQNAPTPFTSYSLFYNGRFVTNEILSENKFKDIVKEFANV